MSQLKKQIAIKQEILQSKKIELYLIVQLMMKSTFFLTR